MLDRTHPVVLRFANAARSRYRCLTAFRLGFLVGECGEAGEDLSCPYDDEHGRELFVCGVEAGERYNEAKKNPAQGRA